MVGRIGKIDMCRWGRNVEVPQMEVQRIVWGPDVRMLRYVCGKQSVQEGEGKVCQGYREQHPACLTVKAAIVFLSWFRATSGHSPLRISGPVAATKHV